MRRNNPSVLPSAIQLPLHKGALFLCTNFLFCIVQEVLSDDKDSNEQCTRVSLPCVKGGGPRSGGRIVTGHKVTFLSSRIEKKKMSNAQTQASTSWRGRGTVRQGRTVEGVNTDHELTFLRNSNEPRLIGKIRAWSNPCLPCVKGGGPRSGGRIVAVHKLTLRCEKFIKSSHPPLFPD